MFRNPLTAKLVAFVRSVGIDVLPATLEGSTLFPGLDNAHGAVLVDEERLIHPGVILHEAGHLAVTHPSRRMLPKLEPEDGEELAAIAWEYAAACHLGLPAAVVFHPGSYRGDEGSLLENFAAGRYIGVPLLQYFQMTYEPRLAAEQGVPPYPHMRCWLRP